MVDNKLRFAITLALPLTLLSGAPTLHAFTQSGVGSELAGNGVPMGHEWLVRMGAYELIGDDPILKPDANDPRHQWPQDPTLKKGLAKNTELGEAGKALLAKLTRRKLEDKRYQSGHPFIYSAIVGERWVDIGGFNVAKSSLPVIGGKHDCWDAVAQEPADVQQDHFMRRYDDSGAQGGVDAAERSRARFIDHFVKAATAEDFELSVWDGGRTGILTQVDMNYFLFGRAAHLFQDAFSLEHTVRTPADNYQRVRQVKSYLCATGAEQHTHNERATLNYSSGDVIWKIGSRFKFDWPGYKAVNMKDVALVATEATKDLWAAFIRTMAAPAAEREAKARAEAQTLVDNWLSYDKNEMLKWYDNEENRIQDYVRAEGEDGKGMSQSECMTKLLGVESGDQMEKVKALEAERNLCIYNVLPNFGHDHYDPYLKIPYNWRWRNKFKWKTPPEGWQPELK